MPIKCLLLETKSQRFFTSVKNYKHLVEYCKAFGAKMFIVKADVSRSAMLDLSKLVIALCDKNHKGQKIKFKIIENKKVK